jgi:hypothetical protein
LFYLGQIVDISLFYMEQIVERSLFYMGPIVERSFFYWDRFVSVLKGQVCIEVLFFEPCRDTVL